MTYIIKSFFRMLVSCIFTSIIFNYFYIHTNLAENSGAMKVVGIFLIFLFCMYNGKIFRQNFEEINDGLEYSFYHILSLIIMLVIIFLLSLFVQESTMRWAFSLADIFGFVIPNINDILSLLCFGGLNLFIIFVVTLIP